MSENRQRRFAQVAIALATLLLGGCGANHYSIYRHESLAGDLPSATFIDAKQRAIIATTVPIPNNQGGSTGGNRLVVCAEPSPDVFSVLAQSASGTGSFGQSADPKSVQAAASFAYSSAEQGASLARTQTINMLREAMFRTCERYMNGAIGSLEMPIQAVRDQRMMVATLAIEQLTAAATPRVVTVGASGSSAAGASANDAVVKLADAQAALAKANATLKDKQSAFDVLNGTATVCDAIKAKADAKQTLTADETSKQGDCSKAQSDLAGAKTDQQTASQNLDTLQKAAAQGGGGPASATTTVQAPSEAGGTAGASSDIQQVASAVTEIVKANYDQDEVLLLCLRVAGDASLPKDDSLVKTCVAFIQARVAASQAQAEADSVKAQAERASYVEQLTVAEQAIEGARTTAFTPFWAKVVAADGKSIDSAKLASVIDSYVTAKRPAARRRIEALKGQPTRDALQDAFGKLPQKDQESLGK
ncbi:MAG TPA: hypothetical protein VF459_13850 [Caulobacteraceae bacterium]